MKPSDLVANAFAMPIANPSYPKRPRRFPKKLAGPSPGRGDAVQDYLA